MENKWERGDDCMEPVGPDEIRIWLQNGIRKGATHCLIIHDSWNFNDYPVYVMPNQDVRAIASQYLYSNESILEVYNLSLDIEQQINDVRTVNF